MSDRAAALTVVEMSELIAAERGEWQASRGIETAVEPGGGNTRPGEIEL